MHRYVVPSPLKKPNAINVKILLPILYYLIFTKKKNLLGRYSCAPLIDGEHGSQKAQAAGPRSTPLPSSKVRVYI